MARMHTGRHGRSKSRKPWMEPGKRPEDLKLNDEEAVKLIVEYAKQGKPQALIGQMLKERHGVPYIKQQFNKRLNVILSENGFRSDIPPDLMDLFRKAIRLRRHIEKNHNDVHNKTSLSRLESKIWRLSNYYKSTGAMPSNWKYDPVQVALLIKR